MALAERKIERPTAQLLLEAETAMLNAKGMLDPFLVAARHELMRDFTPSHKMRQALIDAETTLHMLNERLAAK